jgi:hypothetical protein
MPALDLLYMCASAFLAVFVLLTALAAIMRLILIIFPKQDGDAEAAVYASIAATMQGLYPGARVTKVEEIK